MVFVPDVDDGLIDFDEAGEVDGGGADDYVAGGAVDGGFQVSDLLFAVTHGGKDVFEVGVLFEGVFNGIGSVWPGIDDFSGAVLLGGQIAGSELHFAVGDSGSVLDNQDFFSFDGLGIFGEYYGVGFDNCGAGIEGSNILFDCFNLFGIGGIDFIDDGDVGQI